jgi:hypothetical protein
MAVADASVAKLYIINDLPASAFILAEETESGNSTNMNLYP